MSVYVPRVVYTKIMYSEITSVYQNVSILIAISADINI